MAKLKPCPFCGEIPKLIEILSKDEMSEGFTIFNSKLYADETKEMCYGCSNCDEAYSTNPDEVVEAWNTRKDVN